MSQFILDSDHLSLLNIFNSYGPPLKDSLQTDSAPRSILALTFSSRFADDVGWTDDGTRRWQLARCTKEWCQRHFFQFRSLVKAREVRAQLLEICQRCLPAKDREAVTSRSSGATMHPKVIRKAICAGFFFNAAR